jgi:ABC-2 type transport system permease protein
MSGFLTIFRRELAGLFLSPLAWVLLCVALVLNGLLFTKYVELTGGDVGLAFSLALGNGRPFWGLMLFLPPLLTMRMVSEEARSGLLEFLLTAPVSDFAVILGKAAAATTFMAVLWSTTLLHGLVLQMLGTGPDWLPLLGAVLGATLVSGLFCAIGIAMSAATSVPIVAAFLAFIANTFLFSLPVLGTLFKLPRGHWVNYALGHTDVITQFQASFGTGVLDTKHLVFFVAWTGFFVFLATRLLEARRWR